MKLILNILITLYILSLTACNMAEELKNPVLSQLGTVTFTANNITYQMQGRGSLLVISPDRTNNNLVITGTNTQKETIALNINGFNVQQPYKVSQNIVIGLANNGITQATNLCSQSVSVTPNSITITEFDNQRKLVKGQFRGTLCGLNSTIAISNGNFYVEFD